MARQGPRPCTVASLSLSHDTHAVQKRGGLAFFRGGVAAMGTLHGHCFCTSRMIFLPLI